MNENFHIHRTEQLLLGSLINNESLAFINSNVLKKEHFFSEQHQYIFVTILKLIQKGIPVDLPILIQITEDEEKLSFIGGKEYLRYLFGLKQPVENLQTYAEILSLEFLRGKLRATGEQFIANSLQTDLNIRSVYRNAIRSLENALYESEPKSIKSISENITTLIQSFGNRSSDKQTLFTGISEIDKLTGGFQKGALTILGARTGMGKTGFLVYLLLNCLRLNKVAGGYLAFADNSKGITKRCLEILKAHVLKYPDLNEDKFINEASNLFYLNDEPATSTGKLFSKLTRMKKQFDVEVVVIDYLQMLGKGESGRHFELDRILRQLKVLAGKLDIAIIIASQLNRSVETRGGDKLPQLTDLRDCGTVEELADMIMFLYRPAYYGLVYDENKNDVSDLTELIVAKNNHGDTGNVVLNTSDFLPGIKRFTDNDFINLIKETRLADVT